MKEFQALASSIGGKVATFIAIIGIVFYILKHVREWLEYGRIKRSDYIEVLKKLTNDIKNEEYQKAYIIEEKNIFFSILTGRSVFSEKKRYFLLKLLNKEIITKKDIRKYLHHFYEKNGKICIKITFFDKLEIWFLRLLSLYFFLFSLILLFGFSSGHFMLILGIKLMGLILLLFAFGAFLSSFKMDKLNQIKKDLELHHLLDENC